MGNAAGSLEQPEGTEAGINPTLGYTIRKKTAPPKLPMPPEDELEERFNVVLVSHREWKHTCVRACVCVYV